MLRRKFNLLGCMFVISTTFFACGSSAPNIVLSEQEQAQLLDFLIADSLEELIPSATFAAVDTGSHAFAAFFNCDSGVFKSSGTSKLLLASSNIDWTSQSSQIDACALQSILIERGDLTWKGKNSVLGLGDFKISGALYIALNEKSAERCDVFLSIKNIVNESQINGSLCKEKIDVSIANE